MASCAACGLKLETHEYQSRSADEAHTTVITCAKCPVDAFKLNPVADMHRPYVGLQRQVRRPTHGRVKSAGAKSGISYRILMDIPKDHKWRKMTLTEEHITVSQKAVTYSYGGKALEVEGLMSVSGPSTGVCLSTQSTITIGMGVTCEEYVTYVPAPVTPSDKLCVQGRYCKVDNVSGEPAYVYVASGTTNPRVLVTLSRDVSSKRWCQVVTELYMRGLAPTNPMSYIKRDTLAMLSNLSARAWDVTSPPTSGHVFTSKPDGERMWLLLYGSIWYFVRPRVRGPVRQWLTCHKLEKSATLQVVLDVEYLLRHGSAVIDVLMTSDGVLSETNRDVNWVSREYTKIATSYYLPGTFIRHYYYTVKEAQKYTESVPYPTDGIVAIRHGSTETLKVKETKSVELKHVGNGDLHSADGLYICTIPQAIQFDVDCILEVRFIVDSDTKNVIVKDLFERSDKATANSTAAVSNIFGSAVTVTAPGDNERRAALLWCNDLRQKVQQRAMNRRSNNCIILDIGSGDGQSLNSMLSTESLSYVFVEPDETKCKSLARRANTRKVYTKPSDILPQIRSLITRSTTAVVLNCTLSDVLEDEEVCSRLLPELKCVMCTFSMHFVAESLQTLSVQYSVPVYGCTYLYDSATDGTLLDTSGVTMKIENDEIARVSWGRDQAYTEPVTFTTSYAGAGRVIAGSELLSLPDIRTSSSANTICSKVYVLVP